MSYCNKKKAPVLFIIFNRPDNTKRVFSAIRNYQPNILYIAADGPREEIENEIKLCTETRAIVNQVDWSCEVKTLFNEKNVGCGIGVSSAINWFFKYEESGIILEDDCLPNQDFFLFCNEMLIKYKSNSEIMQINGFNSIFNNCKSNKYFKTIYPKIWGWATWKNRWDKYSYKLDQWEEYVNNKNTYILRYCLFEGIIRHLVWKKLKNKFDNNLHVSTWDYQWNFCIMMNNGLCIQPQANLIQNIGMDSGTHYSSLPYKNLIEHKFGTILTPFVEDYKISNYFDSKIRYNFIVQTLKNNIMKFINIFSCLKDLWK